MRLYWICSTISEKTYDRRARLDRLDRAIAQRQLFWPRRRALHREPSIGLLTTWFVLMIAYTPIAHAGDEDTLDTVLD